MIVNYTDSGWQVVTQRAHGMLAAKLAAQWKAKERTSRWVETLLAIAEHDDAEVELDGENLVTSTGGPLNFDMKVFDKQHCEKLFMLTQTKSRYIALLTSLHMEFLYRKDAAKNIQAKAFLKQQATLRKKWSQALQLTDKDLLRIYDLVEWCDACSLLLCQGLLQPENRMVEISTGPDKKTYHLLQTSSQTISITPWPFEVKRFMVNFEWRLIKKLQFSSSAEFRKEFLKASVRETIWNVVQQRTSRKIKKV
jgi:hypothetical protein